MLRQNSKCPLLSICVPTFNRATCLENLLKNLEAIKRAFGNEVEICVSNNHSTDETAQVIDAWRERLSLKTVTQEENIGATRNCIEVTRLASGRWIQIIGDDDEYIVSNFGKLIGCLKGAKAEDWVLLGTKKGSIGRNPLGRVKNGTYAANEFRRILLRIALYELGFLGQHVFPKILREKFFLLGIGKALSWPHLALFLRHLRGGRIKVLSDPVVTQAACGAKLYWDYASWVSICRKRLVIIAEERKEFKGFQWFPDCLILRELYSPTMLRQLVKWKILEPSDFYQRAFVEYTSWYRTLDPNLSMVASIHFIYFLTVFFTPHIVFRCLLRIMGKDTIGKYLSKKELMRSFDGKKRGL